MNTMAIKTLEKDILIIDTLSIILLLTIVLFPDSSLRAVLGVPFVLFFPGYVLISTLFPRKNDLGNLERAALSMGLSLAVVPLVGLALNYTSWGIRLYPVIISLLILTLLLSFTSNYRRAKLSVEQRFSFSFPQIQKRNIGKNDKLFLTGFLVALLVICGSTVYLVSAPKSGDHFTEFYVLGSNGNLADYPVNLTLGETGTVILGVTNHEYENLNYKITAKLNNQTIDTIENIQLSHDKTWNQTFSFTPKTSGENIKLEFQLYKSEATEVYRSLQLLINAQPPE